MTHRTDPDLLNNILQLISDQGTDGLAEGRSAPAPSSSTSNSTAKLLDVELHKWRTRPLPCGGLGGCGGFSRRSAQPPKGGLKKKCVQMG